MAVRESFADFMQRARAQVDEALDRFLPTAAVCPGVVSEAMRYSVFAGGKRLRPILTLAAADAAAAPHGHGSRDAGRIDALRLALPAACAIELIHTYSLIHDDLPAMDNDSFRRGRPTSFKPSEKRQDQVGWSAARSSIFKQPGRCPARC